MRRFWESISHLDTFYSILERLVVQSLVLKCVFAVATMGIVLALIEGLPSLYIFAISLFLLAFGIIWLRERRSIVATIQKEEWEIVRDKNTKQQTYRCWLQLSVTNRKTQADSISKITMTAGWNKTERDGAQYDCAKKTSPQYFQSQRPPLELNLGAKDTNRGWVLFELIRPVGVGVRRFFKPKNYSVSVEDVYGNKFKAIRGLTQSHQNTGIAQER